MTTAIKTSDLSRFCSVCARQAGVDPVGYAHAYAHVLALEIPLPWPSGMYSAPGTFPQEILDFYKLSSEAYQRGESLHMGVFAIAPDPAYSVAGHRRVISYKRPDGLYASFEQQEYLVPEELAGPLCWALLLDHSLLASFALYLQPPSGARDLMVCTHGAVDAACAKFGFPIYRHLRRLADQTDEHLRIWRVSHFGGHIFAPTLIDMPEFRYWGYVEREEADLIAQRGGEVLRLRDHYRGWAGFESPLLQAAERELFVRYGWQWVDYVKEGRILTQQASTVPDDPDAEPTWAEVRIDYAAPNGNERGAYIARVEMTGRIDCIYSTGEAETYAYPQYTVASLERVVASGVHNQ